MTENIKATYRNHLITFIVINIAIFWIFIVTHADLSSIAELYKNLSAKESIVLVLAPILCLVLSGLLSAEAKARLIFQRIDNPLPGSRAFTEYMLKDTRVAYQVIQERYSPLPSEPHEQNRLWYKLYKSVESDSVVVQSHRNWLFSRDLSAYAAIILFVFGLFSLVSSASWLNTSIYIAYLILQLVVLIIPARNYGKRFVTNVLSVVSTN